MIAAAARRCLPRRTSDRGARDAASRPLRDPRRESGTRDRLLSRTLLGWEFNQWGKEPYWLIKTGEKGTPGIDGGLMPRRGAGPADMQAVNAFVCTVDVADLRRIR